MNRSKVKSSNLNSIGYDEDKKELEVEFKGGRLYIYSAVPKEIYEALMQEQADVVAGKPEASVGKAYLKLVKNTDYDFSKQDYSI